MLRRYLLQSICLLHLTVLVPTAHSATAQVTYRMREMEAVGTQIGNIRQDVATLLQAPADSSLRLADSNHFDLKEGYLVIKHVFDRETDCFEVPCLVSDILVFVQSSGGSVDFLKISVEVEDVNDHAPEFPRPLVYVVNITESVKINSTYVIRAAFDKDLGNNSIKEYQLVSPDNDQTFGLIYSFQGPQDSLMVVLRKPLNRETKSQYSFTVVAVDGGTPPLKGNKTVIVNIRDANDNSPVFSSHEYLATVVENKPAGTFVTKVLATDKDDGENAVVRYYFSTRTSDTFKALFDIDISSGEITTRQQLDRESYKEIVLDVEARDLGNDAVPAYCQVKVTVGDENDEAPEIRVDSIVSDNTVAEGRDPDVQVALVTVQDKDSGLNGQVECEANSIDFELDPQDDTTSYILTLKSKLDREQKEKHTIRIRCWDRGTPPKEKFYDYVLTVGDVNDEAPSFTQRENKVQITENNEVNDLVTQVFAVDKDVGDNRVVTYALDVDAGDKFKINPNTGEIRANAVFDREATPKFTFHVLATDKGQPPLTGSTKVEVTVLDVNDVSPTFRSDPVELHLEENSSPRATVGTIVADDGDLLANGEVRYTILKDGGDWESFQLDSTMGILRAKQTFDREIKPEFLLKVEAKDGGVIPKSSTASVRIIIDDQNDNAPEIVSPKASNSVFNITFHSSRGTPVTQISARDRDTGINAALAYEFHDSNEHGLFHLHNRTGALTVAHRMGTDMVGVHRLVVAVSDQGRVPLKTFVHLSVFVGVYDNETAIYGQLQNSESVRTNLNIVIAVAVVSGVLAVILLIAIVILLRRQGCKGVDGTDRNQLYPPSSTSSEDGKASLEAGGSDASSGRKKEVSFSNDVERFSLNRSFPDHSNYGHHLQKPLRGTRNHSEDVANQHSKYPELGHVLPTDQYKYSSHPQEGRAEGQGRYHAGDSASVKSDADSGRGASEEEIHAHLRDGDAAAAALNTSAHFHPRAEPPFPSPDVSLTHLQGRGSVPARPSKVSYDLGRHNDTFSETCDLDDGATTTSGSYTVDADEIVEQIDQLLFSPPTLRV